MDLILIAPMEVSLRNKRTFREEIIRSDFETLDMNPVNSLYVKRFRENLGIAALASFLRAGGYSVKIINANTGGNSVPEIVKEVINDNPAVVGISLLYDLHAYNTCNIAHGLRVSGYNGHITIGGPFATFTYDYFLAAIPEINSVARGEGELTLLELIQAIREGKDWRGIDGLAWRHGQEIIVNPPPRRIENLSDLPFASRDSIKLLKENGMAISVASIYSSRGCMGRCTYCTAPSSAELAGVRRWRGRAAEHVVDEIENLVNEYKIGYLYFCDDNFFGYGIEGKKRLYKLAEEILRRGLGVKFHAEVRVDSYLDVELLKLLKKAGLQDVLLGIESGAQSALNRWRKGTTIEQNKKAVSLMKELGFQIEPAMIMTDPYTTVQEFRETADFILETGLHECNFPLYLFNQMVIFPGTAVEMELKDKGIIKCPDIWSDFGDMNDPMQRLEFCKKVSSRSYEIIDPFVRAMWDGLIYYTNHITWLAEEVIPVFMGKWRHTLMSMAKNERRADEEVLIEFTSKLKEWRRSLGELSLKLMYTALEWADKGDYLAVRELDLSLKNVADGYDIRYFGKKIEDLISEQAVKHGFDSGACETVTKVKIGDCYEG